MNIVSRYTVEEFGHEVRQSLDANIAGMESVLQLGHLLQRFGAENSRDYFWSIGEPATISSGLPGQKLYDDPDGMFRLLLAQYPPNMPTAIHSHEGWVVVGLLEGSERYTSWRRVDDGSTPLATLELVQDHHILPGEFGYLYDGPFNVHRQSAEAEGAVELVLMKGRGQRLEHIDESTGECSQPMELNR